MEDGVGVHWPALWPVLLLCFMAGGGGGFYKSFSPPEKRSHVKRHYTWKLECLGLPGETKQRTRHCYWQKPLFFFPKSLSKVEVTSSSIKTGLLNSHGLAGWYPLDWNACPARGASDSDGAVWDIWSPHPLPFNQVEWCICVRPGRPLWLSATVALGPTDWLIKQICYILTSLWKFRKCCVIGFSRSVYSLL